MGTWWNSPDSVRTVNEWLQGAAVYLTAAAAIVGILSLFTTRRLGILEPSQAAIAEKLTAAEVTAKEAAAALSKAEAGASQTAKDLANAQRRMTEAEQALAATQQAQAEREAALRKELDQAKADAAKANATLAPRRLSAEQRAKFLAFLPKQADKGPLSVVAAMNDPESIEFGEQLRTLLVQAGWKVQGVDFAAFAGSPRGVIVVTKDPKNPSAVWLQRALEHIGIDAPGELNPKASKDVELVVGHKP